MTEPTANAAPPAAPPAARTERGWAKLLIALAAFLFLPTLPQMRALLPIDQTMLLFVPAVAACALVGWWAGGRVFLAVAWVAIAVLLALQPGDAANGFDNLVRGWSLLLAGAFGLVCLFDLHRPLFTRALLALGITLLLAMIMSLFGPVTVAHASKTVADEFARRNGETMSTLNGIITSHPVEWKQLTDRVPQFAEMPAETSKELDTFSDWGRQVFPALLALESLAALALAWSAFHRFSRTRVGPPLHPLRDFRFNDQLVWGLIVGLVIMLLPTLSSLNGVGKNLLVFFGALYALRGFGVLSWFMSPGRLALTLAIGFVMLFAPVLNYIAALAFMMLGVAALALGLGDTWADWRSRARTTL
ncbi:MAG TPA: DUF2232 domain-containing protein [Gemmatimonadaceae bacterium]|nr:DUF2232 domain-containing protein [Gemmatimonadaceae bacterium]